MSNRCETPPQYADPGYRRDGKKRYPVQSLGLAVAAWSYANMSKNAKLYSYEQHEEIKTRIVRALTAFGAVPKAGDYSLPPSWSAEKAEKWASERRAKGSQQPEQREASEVSDHVKKRKAAVPPAVKPAWQAPAAKQVRRQAIADPPDSLPPIRLLRAYAAMGEIPMFEISTDDIRGFCVYVLLEDERPIYVGQSINILGRLSEHLRNQEKGVRTTTMQILKVPSKPHMDELELRLIQLYQPEFNTRGKSIDSYLSAG